MYTPTEFHVGISYDNNIMQIMLLKGRGQYGKTKEELPTTLYSDGPEDF